MNYSKNLHFILKDLMHFYKLEFKRTLDCITNYNLEIPDYSRFAKYDEEYRLIELNKLLSAWARGMKYQQLVDYNRIVARCNRGFDIIDHTSDEKKLSEYQRALLILVNQHEVLATQLNIKRASQEVQLPYIFTEIEKKRT